MSHQSLAVHPELRNFANKIPQITFTPKNLWLWRFLLNFLRGAKSLPDVTVENTFIPSPDGSAKIRLRLYRPKLAAAPTPALLWLHGGGYLIGKPEMDDACCIQYARALGIAVISVDYRCAPEHAFPAPLEDCYAALKWAHAQARQLGIDAQRMAVGGNSAGGGLAAALAQLALDRGEIKLVFQLLVYPMLDDRTCLRSDIANRAHLAWNQDSNRFGWQSYLGMRSGAAGAPAYAVPARRTDLSGLPPAWIGVGTLDLFHAEDVAYAHRLQECGAACELHVVPGAFHGFDTAAPQAQVVQDFRAAQIAALKRHLVSG